MSHEHRQHPERYYDDEGEALTWNEPVSERCQQCAGEGAVSGWPDTPWEECPECMGTGRR